MRDTLLLLEVAIVACCCLEIVRVGIFTLALELKGLRCCKVDLELVYLIEYLVIGRSNNRRGSIKSDGSLEIRILDFKLEQTNDHQRDLNLFKAGVISPPSHR